uniref:Uncharacterized protein n=1 Tax=Fagus sylvatica TaxID=28930 RepID=A0A2N9FDT0_FAGSY
MTSLKESPAQEFTCLDRWKLAIGNVQTFLSWWIGRTRTEPAEATRLLARERIEKREKEDKPSPGFFLRKRTEINRLLDVSPETPLQRSNQAFKTKTHLLHIAPWPALKLAHSAPPLTLSRLTESLSCSAADEWVWSEFGLMGVGLGGWCLEVQSARDWWICEMGCSRSGVGDGGFLCAKCHSMYCGMNLGRSMILIMMHSTLLNMAHNRAKGLTSP